MNTTTTSDLFTQIASVKYIIILSSSTFVQMLWFERLEIQEAY